LDAITVSTNAWLPQPPPVPLAVPSYLLGACICWLLEGSTSKILSFFQYGREEIVAVTRGVGDGYLGEPDGAVVGEAGRWRAGGGHLREPSGETEQLRLGMEYVVLTNRK
jgi:hypothetical protein